MSEVGGNVGARSGPDGPAGSAATGRSPSQFFLLVFALAAPLWALGALSERGLLRNQGTNLPVSALAFVCPILAALVLVRRREGSASTREFLRRVFDLTSIRPRSWYIPILVLLPLLYALAYLILRVGGVALPSPQTSLPTILVLLVAFSIAALCEEAGWTGYATDPLQERLGALGAALLLGLVWAAFHVVPDVQAGQTWSWIAGQRGYSVALRVLIVWIYNNTGRSVPAAVLFHAMDNVSVYVLFPDDGDGHYEPAVTAALTAAAAAIVTVLWGARTLDRFRYRH